MQGKRKQSNNGKNKQTKGRKKNSQKQHAITVRPVQGPIADTYIANFTFTDTALVWSAGGFFGLSFRFRANACFDPDPVVGGNSVVGWTEMTELYDRYKVLSVHYEWSVANRNTDSMLVGFLPTATDVGTYTTSSQVSLALGQPRARSKVLSVSTAGLSNITVSGTLSMEDIFGTKEYRYDDVYSAEMTANPSRIGMLNFLVASPVLLNYGVTTYLKVTYHTELYRRESLLTPAFKTSPQRSTNLHVIAKEVLGPDVILLRYEDGSTAYVDNNGNPVPPPERQRFPPIRTT